MYDDYIIDILSQQFEDEINKALDSYEIKPCGYFPEPYNIGDELYIGVQDYMNESIGELPVFEQIIDDSGEIIKEVKIDLTEAFEKIIEDRKLSEQSYVDVGQVVLNQLEKFIEQGVWQFGLKDQNGHINTNSSTWPKPVIKCDNIIWQDDSSDLMPIIWFGLKDEAPLECWTLSKDLRMNDEEWKSFWFNKFWTFDWNILFDYNGDGYIIWMFAECDMDEPSIDNVIATCPVLLDKNDTTEILMKKIDEFF